MHTGAKLNFLIFIIYIHHVRTCINGWMDYISSHHMKAEMQIEILPPFGNIRCFSFVK
jgi:hypothetical protein